MIAARRRRRLAGPQLEGYVETPLRAPLEALRQDSDDGVRSIVECDGRVENVASSPEAIEPQRVAQHRDGGATVLVLVGGEEPAERRLHLM